MKVVLLLMAAAALASAQTTIEEEFEDFKARYNKKYETDAEHYMRFKIFSQNMQIISRHNLEAASGQHTYTLGVNKYADLNTTEFKQLMLGTQVTVLGLPETVEDFQKVPDALPKTVDWRTKGYVTGVKDQGQCGSCWAFSAIGAVEGAHFNRTKKLVSLSEMNVVNCDKADDGCGGGLMDNAFQYIIKNKGVDTEASYPYFPYDGKCLFKPEDVGATISSYKDIKSGSEQALKVATAKVGPIAVAIDAGYSSFQLYNDGVYYEPDCSQVELDHGVLVVGYGTSDNGSDYWLVKNSWGTTWGMQGYIMMSRNRNNNCGIASSASYPIV